MRGTAESTHSPPSILPNNPPLILPRLKAPAIPLINRLKLPPQRLRVLLRPVRHARRMACLHVPVVGLACVVEPCLLGVGPQPDAPPRGVWGVWGVLSGLVGSGFPAAAGGELGGIAGGGHLDDGSSLLVEKRLAGAVRTRTMVVVPTAYKLEGEEKRGPKRGTSSDGGDPCACLEEPAVSDNWMTGLTKDWADVLVYWQVRH